MLRRNTITPDALKELLRPPPSPLTHERIRALDIHFAEVIDGRIQELYPDGNLREILRYPPVEVLHEAPDQHVWFPVPGMYGGFDITLRCRLPG